MKRLTNFINEAEKSKKQKEYQEFLDLSLRWFEIKEDYTKCIEIKKFLSDLEASKRKITRPQNYREKVI